MNTTLVVVKTKTRIYQMIYFIDSNYVLRKLSFRFRRPALPDSCVNRCLSLKMKKLLYVFTNNKSKSFYKLGILFYFI